MKNRLRLNPFACLLMVLAVALTPALRARQDDSVTPPPAEKKTDEAKPAPSAPAAGAAEPASDAKSAPTVQTPASPAATPARVETSDGKDSSDETESSLPPASDKKEHRHGHGHHTGNERVSFWQNSTLASDESADAVVSILGSSSSAGDVGDAVVSILGSTQVTGGTVGDAAVSVLGSTHVENCTIGDAVVSVFGTSSVNGHVRGQVVAVLGNVELGPKAVVDGEVVCIGGEVKREAGSVVRGHVQNVAIAGHSLGFDWLHAWFEKCLLYARPLAFDARLLWAWLLALAFLGFYALLALVVPDSVNRCVQTLEQRPGSSLLAAVLTMLLTPVVCLLLVLTLALAIGFVLLPLFGTGLFLAGLFGRVVMLAWIGRRILKLLSGGADSGAPAPVLAVLVGGVVMLLLYTVPVLGFIVYKVTGVLGLGVVVYTLILQSKANRAAKAPAAPPVAPVPPVAPTPPAPPAGSEAVPPLVIPAVAPTGAATVISAATLPRAGFWIRVAASFIDVVLVAMASAFIHIGPGFMLLFVGYIIVMWATKGTTVGGIICGLKVVRLDDRPIDWSIAIIRALGGFLSLVVAGLGFMWVAFDDDRQSWHDKIAGTTIVCVPKGTPLL